MGLWPDSGGGLWSEILWEACTSANGRKLSIQGLPEVGCDCATGKGGDFFGLHGRWGVVSLLHSTSNTMDPVVIFGKVKEMCDVLARFATSLKPGSAAPVDPRRIQIKIDDDGVGCAVGAFLRKDLDANGKGYDCVQVSAASVPKLPDRYPNKRSELWFETVDKAKAGLIYLMPTGIIPGMGLDQRTLRRLKQQFMAPEWKLDSASRRVVEPKDKTKEKLGRSPDDSDSCNLGHYDAPAGGMQMVEPLPRQPTSAYSQRMRR